MADDKTIKDAGDRIVNKLDELSQKLDKMQEVLEYIATKD